jgi:hypothetical protein
MPYHRTHGRAPRIADHNTSSEENTLPVKEMVIGAGGDKNERGGIIKRTDYVVTYETEVVTEDGRSSVMAMGRKTHISAMTKQEEEDVEWGVHKA